MPTFQQNISAALTRLVTAINTVNTLAQSALQPSSIADIRKFIFGYNNTGTNSATPNVSLTPNTTDTNNSITIGVKGTGAITAQIPDGTLVGGNARGANSIDFQSIRNAIAQVASGGFSVIMGGRFNTASASGTVVLGGNGNTASGNLATVLGGNINTASGAYSIAAGYGARATQSGQYAHQGFQFTSSGDNQASDYPLAVACTVASTDYVLTGDHASPTTTNQIIVPVSSLVNFEGVVLVRRKTSDGVANMLWAVQGAAIRAATGNCSILGTPSIVQLFGLSPPPGWSISVGVDTTNGTTQCVKISFNMGATPMNVIASTNMRSNNLTYA